MDHLHSPAQWEDSAEGGSVDEECRNDARQTGVDGTIDFLGRQGNEAGREVRNQALEAQKVMLGDGILPLDFGRRRVICEA